MSASATYSSDGNRMTKTTDIMGKETLYGYNANTNVLEWVQYPEDTAQTRTEYTYDAMYRMAEAACTTDTGSNLSATYSYTDDLLTGIQTPSTAYSFTYGDFGLRTAVKIGSRTLAEYTYTNDRNRYLQSLDYGNGDSVEYTYDNKGRVTSQTYEDGDTVTYTYDNNGALAKMTDSATGITTTYYYDSTERMMKYVESASGYSHSVGYAYDSLNNLTRLVETVDGVERTTDYTYDDDNRVESVSTDGVSHHYTYDSFGRVSEQTTKHNGTDVLTKTMTFQSSASGKTSGQVATYTIDAGNYDVTYTYTYDDNGNILTISDGTNTTSYVYDSQNQLLRENNQAGGFTHVWEYDNAGNILSRTEYAYTTGELGEPTDTVTYTYGNSQWGDLLTDYDGQTITYDQIGNPLSDGEWTYTWEHGRELATISNGTTTWTNTYNADGLRIKRTDGTNTYTYTYNGSQLMRMTKNTDTLYFTYDASGTPSALTYNGTVYYYVTNLQGDVVAMLDSTGTAVVTYRYDAWGWINSKAGSMASTLGTLNPLRYRGYVYDEETRLYYLESRYYDPELGRFINGDGFVSTGQGILGSNMFAYCGNNPVRFMDESGHRYCAAGSVRTESRKDREASCAYQNAVARKQMRVSTGHTSTSPTTKEKIGQLAKSLWNNIEASVGAGQGLYVEGDILDIASVQLGIYGNYISLQLEDGKFRFGQEYNQGISLSFFGQNLGANKYRFIENGVDIINQENAGFYEDETWTIFSVAIYPTAGVSLRLGFDVVQFCEDCYKIFN